MYLISDLIFSKVPALDSIDMEFPNLHYFVADLKKINIPNSGEVSSRERYRKVLLSIATSFLLMWLTLHGAGSLSYRTSQRGRGVRLLL